jgi:adenine C2-methylase RlmN of 23S rRNA A2503 and tRNA A37
MCAYFAGVTTSKVVQRVPSEGGLKLVVELASGHRVETVLILHDHKSSGTTRCTVCVSSQVGCARACSFCATGTMGIVANLHSAEILEQVWHARNEVPQGYSVRNVVFMGMGEPLDNFDALHGALRGLTHQALFDLSSKHLTVSTVGALPERIRRLADVAPKVRLALSLHSATLPLRQRLIPSATSMPALTSALDYHARTTRCGLMVEYLLIDGLNDNDADADALAGFCAERDAAFADVAPPLSRKQARAAAGYVNLIPFNPTAAGDANGYATPSDERVERFHSRLREKHGVNALVRWTSTVGRDAQGACGQLVV